MALSQHTITVTTKAGKIRSVGTADHDFSAPSATLVAAQVLTDSDDALRSAGTTATASIDAGVVTVQVDGPVGVGSVDVLVTVNS